MRKFITLTRVYYAYMLEYRAEIVLWMLAGILPFILMGIWIKLANLGFTKMDGVDFARYFLSVFITHELVVVWVIWEFESAVLNGTLSPYLLQPLDPAWRFIAQHISERLSRLPFMLGLIAAFFAIYPSAFWVPKLLDILIYIPVVILVFILRFLIQYTLSFLAFWTERVSQLENINFAIYMFLSGYFAPLDVFPKFAKDLAYLTPFPYMIYLPVNILTGKGVDTMGIFILLAWTVFFWIVNRLVWNTSLK
ncbi:MAG: ABC-2 family transporter protein, partial [candidate division WOR-3 bacterium]